MAVHCQRGLPVRFGTSPENQSSNPNISKLLETLVERLRHCPSSAAMQQSKTRPSAKIPVPTPAPTSAARAALRLKLNLSASIR